MRQPVALLFLALSGPATAAFYHGNQMVPPPLEDDDFESKRIGKRATGRGFFDQLIDHKNPSTGTFKQQYWWSDEFYKGPGSPVIFFTPGEAAAARYTGYLTNRTLPGLFAQAVGGASVMLEHRYYGASSPYQNLTTKNLQYLDLANSISDVTRFAREARFPFDTNGESSANKAPWVFSGGSYSGALAGWVESIEPGTFWAYHASSAVVQAVGDFWQYFEPVRTGMPKNCSADVSKVIEHIDTILKFGSPERKQALKKKFGLERLVHDDDFASALENGPWLWQSHDLSSGYSGFFKFCDYVENAFLRAFPNATIPGPEGVGLGKALNGYAKWSREVLAPGICRGYGYWKDPNDLSCLDTYNFSSPLFRDYTVENTGNRQWNWFLCNEPFKYWQNGAPEGRPTLVSRLVNNAYWERQCDNWFPTEDGYTYGIKRGKDEEDINAWTGGWFHTNTTRLLWVNGEFDPWLDATVSSTFRPGGPLESTKEAPVLLIPEGIHCSDLLARNGVANKGVQAVMDEAVRIIKGWVEEYPGYKSQ